MAINLDEELLQLFHQLPESDQHTALEQLRTWVGRKTADPLKEFYANLAEDSEPLSAEELKQLDGPRDYVSWEDASRELGWNLDDTIQS